MQKLAQLSTQDQIALSIGHLLVSSIASASEVDYLTNELQKAQTELAAIKEEVSKVSAEKPRRTRKT